MTTIVTKNSSTASAVPTTSDLVQGELAVNLADKRIFTEDHTTTIVELGTNPSSITTATATVTGTLTANGTFASSNAVLTGGTVNGIVIGGSTPQAITGTTVTASTGFVGGLTGNVTGNLTGNVTGNVIGNVTGDLTGNVTASSGTTTLNNLVVNGTADFTNTKLVNITTPIAGTDAANKTYVDDTVAAVIDSAPAALDTLNELAAALGDDANFAGTVTTALATKLPLAGGTMTGAIAMGTAKITGLGDPTSAQDAATKTYVDTADALKLSLTGGTMSGAIAMGTNKITSVGNPTLAQDAATKDYVDDILGSATSAATSAAAAATSASNASTSASNAASSATTASNAVTSAELAATNAAASYDSFDDRYLGAKASNPATDNDGDALIAGATYFNTTSDSMKVYSGSAWSDVAPVATTVTLSQVTDFPSQSGQSGKYLSTNGTVPSWATLTTDPTLGTLTKTFTTGESSTINLTSSVLAPVVSVTKEVPQSGVTNNNWDVNSTTENYTRLNSAYATTLDWAADLTTATFVDSFSVAGQDTSPQAIAFNTDGTKMFVVGNTGDDVNEYALSTGFDVSTASFTDAFSVASQDTAPTGIAFSTDGTKMFVVGNANNAVYEYTLSTGFDVSTATFVDSFSVSAQDTSAYGLAFNTDGTKMFVAGLVGEDVNEYALSTGFDVSTASFTDAFSVSAQDTALYGLAFNANGAKMFVTGLDATSVYEYALSTVFDVSTASYSQSFSVGTQDIYPVGIAFNTDGTKMFVVGQAGIDVNEYNLDLNSLSLGTGSFASADVGKTIEANSGVFVLTATDGSIAETTAPTSYDQVASGSWEMYGVVYNAVDGDLELSGGVFNTFDVSTASYSQSFSVSAQENSPQGIEFNTDGTKMFVIGTTGDDVNEYALSTGFDVSTASFTDSFSIASQDGVPYDLAFNTDGTKMFILGEQTGYVYQYTLSTGFDVSTASYDSVSFNFGPQESAPHGLTFNTLGTKMFIVGSAGDDVNEYALSTGFDVSTASFTDAFSVAAQDTNPRDIAFNTDGTKMFIVGQTGQDINEYVLTTGFDVSTASYSQNFSIGTEDTQPNGIAFNTNGTKMFIVGATGDNVYQYSIGTTAFPTGYQPVHTTQSTDTTYWTDINSMTADQAAGSGNVYYAISTDDRTTWTVIDNTDGERDIVRNNAGTWQYNSNSTYASETWVNGATNTELATLAEAMEGAAATVGYDLNNASYDSVSFNLSSQDTDVFGMAFSSDGTKMFIMGENSDDVDQYSLSTAWDLSTASYDSVSFNVGSQEAFGIGIAFSSDGTKMYLVGILSDTVYQYSLSTAWDLSSASYASKSFNVSSQDTNPYNLQFNATGTKMYLVGNTNSSIYQYTLSTAWDISTTSYDSVSFSTSSQTTAGSAIAFNLDGSKIFLCAFVGTVFQYSLSTAYDLSSISYDSISFSFSSQENNAYGLVFGNNGTKMFVSGNTDFVYQYSTSTTTYTNQMDKTQLDAVTDPNHIALGDDLDLAIVFNMTSGTTVPSSDGVAINYDANVLNKGAVLGTDYDFDAPAGNAVRVTALAANNLKVRVV
jgi:sugar lactone lactonase YvrE